MEKTETKNETTEAAAPKTALAMIPKSGYAGLIVDPKEMRAALDSLTEAGEVLGPGDLIRVPTPTGGGTTWEIPTLTGEVESTKQIDGVLVYYQKTGILWPSLDPGDDPPVLRTFDMEVAELIGQIPKDMEADLEACRIDERHFRWADLSYNQWGSGKNGKGKRCKEQRMMFVMRPTDPFPILVTCQPGSLKRVTGFIKRFALMGLQYWGAVVSLSLEKQQNDAGQPYAQIVPKLIGRLSPEDTLMVRSTWTEPLAKLVRNIPPEPPVAKDGSTDEG